MADIYSGFRDVRDLEQSQIDSAPPTPPAAQPVSTMDALSSGFESTYRQHTSSGIYNMWQDRLQNEANRLKTNYGVDLNPAHTPSPFDGPIERQPTPGIYEDIFKSKDDYLKNLQQLHPEWNVQTYEQLKAADVKQHVEIGAKSDQVWRDGNIADKISYVVGSVGGYLRDPLNAGLSVLPIGNAVKGATVASNMLRVGAAQSFLGGVLETINMPSSLEVRKQMGERTENSSRVGEVLQSAAIQGALGAATAGVAQVAGKALFGSQVAAKADAPIKNNPYTPNMKETVEKVETAIKEGKVKPTEDIQTNIQLLKEVEEIVKDKPSHVDQVTHIENYAAMRQAIDSGDTHIVSETQLKQVFGLSSKKEFDEFHQKIAKEFNLNSSEYNLEDILKILDQKKIMSGSEVGMSDLEKYKLDEHIDAIHEQAAELNDRWLVEAHALNPEEAFISEATRLKNYEQQQAAKIPQIPEGLRKIAALDKENEFQFSDYQEGHTSNQTPKIGKPTAFDDIEHVSPTPAKFDALDDLREGTITNMRQQLKQEDTILPKSFDEKGNIDSSINASSVIAELDHQRKALKLLAQCLLKGGLDNVA